jgi:hypothetical protein
MVRQAKVIFMMRLSLADKRRVEAAARRAHKSLQAFAEEALLAAARAVPAGRPPGDLFDPWERWVGPALASARHGRPGYRAVGDTAARGMGRLLRATPQGARARRELEGVVAQAVGLSPQAGRAAVLGWWQTWVGERLREIPARRRPQFVEGFLQAFRSGDAVV